MHVRGYQTDLCSCLHRYPGSLTFCSGGTHGYDNDVETMHVRIQELLNWMTSNVEQIASPF